MGMAVANAFAGSNKYNELLFNNYKDFADIEIDGNAVLQALTNDKKNTSTKINIILPAGNIIVKQSFTADEQFWEQCRYALTTVPFKVLF